MMGIKFKKENTMLGCLGIQAGNQKAKWLYESNGGEMLFAKASISATKRGKGAYFQRTMGECFNGNGLKRYSHIGSIWLLRKCRKRK